jgi:hypothetical protein
MVLLHGKGRLRDEYKVTIMRTQSRVWRFGLAPNFLCFGWENREEIRQLEIATFVVL